MTKKGALLQIECVSNTSYEDLVATSSVHGGVVIWSVIRQLKVGMVGTKYHGAVFHLSQSLTLPNIIML